MKGLQSRIRKFLRQEEEEEQEVLPRITSRMVKLKKSLQRD